MAKIKAKKVQFRVKKKEKSVPVKKEPEVKLVKSEFTAKVDISLKYRAGGTVPGDQVKLWRKMGLNVEDLVE